MKINARAAVAAACLFAITTVTQASDMVRMTPQRPANAAPLAANATLNDDPYKQLGPGSLNEATLAVGGGDSTTAKVQLLRYYLELGKSVHVPFWLSTSLPVGSVGKDDVVQSIVSPDGGLLNVAVHPWTADANGDFLWKLNPSDKGVCGFGADPADGSGCVGYARIGVKAIQAPKDASNTYTRVPLGYLTAGVNLQFPIRAGSATTSTLKGGVTIGLFGMVGLLDAKRLDYVFGERIKKSVSLIGLEGNFQIQDTIQLALSTTLANSNGKIGKAHAITLTFASPK